jgi:CBS domain-containing protein
MLVKEVMQSVKIHTIPGKATVQEAAAKMGELYIGALIVGKPKKIEGIFSERDILKKVTGGGLSPETTLIRDVMSTNITTVDEIEMAKTALRIMLEKRFRHLPVVGKNGICLGMVGLRDLMKYVSETLEKQNRILEGRITWDYNNENSGDKKLLVKDVMHKGLHLVSNDISIQQTSEIMAKLDIGCVLVGRPDRLEGIFSERDLMLKVVAKGLSSRDTVIGDVMTKKVITIKETEPVDLALPLMEKKKIRHLPVVNKDGICVAMLGTRDLMGVMLNRLENENKLMVEYLLAASRVALTIMELGSENGIRDGKSLVIKHRFSRNDLEDITDTSRKTLSMVLDNFQDEGLISMAKNKIVVLDKPKLLKKII